MPRKLRFSLIALTEIALVTASASSFAQAGTYRPNDRLRNVGPMAKGPATPAVQLYRYSDSTWRSTTGARKGFVGRNDGYMQQSTQGAASRFQPTKQYGVQVGWWERAQRARPNKFQSEGAPTNRSQPTENLNSVIGGSRVRF